MALAIAPFYNVNYAVGAGRPNDRADVMLVQYFLFHIMINFDGWRNNRGNWTPAAPNIGPAAIFPYTGLYTPDLTLWIRCFQRTANERGDGPLATDGVIDRAHVGWGNPAKPGHGWYTIQAMNRLMWRFNSDAFRNLAEVADLPAEVKADLKIQMPYYDGPLRP
jgi:hypothetical protein